MPVLGYLPHKLRVLCLLIMPKKPRRIPQAQVIAITPSHRPQSVYNCGRRNSLRFHQLSVVEAPPRDEDRLLNYSRYV